MCFALARFRQLSPPLYFVRERSAYEEGHVGECMIYRYRIVKNTYFLEKVTNSFVFFRHLC